MNAGSISLGRHPLDALRLSHNATESASRDGVFFRYHGRLAVIYHFLGRGKGAGHMFKRCDRQAKNQQKGWTNAAISSVAVPNAK